MPSPLTFPTSIPIVGQPFTLHAWFATVLITCNCPAHTPLMIVGPTLAPCLACKKGYQIQSVTFDARTGKAHVNLAMFAIEPEGGGRNGGVLP